MKLVWWSNLARSKDRNKILIEQARCSRSLQMPVLLHGHCLFFQDTLARTEICLREAQMGLKLPQMEYSNIPQTISILVIILTPMCPQLRIKYCLNHTPKHRFSFDKRERQRLCCCWTTVPWVQRGTVKPWIYAWAGFFFPRIIKGCDH